MYIIKFKKIFYKNNLFYGEKLVKAIIYHKFMVKINLIHKLTYIYGEKLILTII